MLKKFLAAFFGCAVIVFGTVTAWAITDNIKLDSSMLTPGGYTSLVFNAENPTDPDDRCIKLQRLNTEATTETWAEAKLSDKIGYKLQGRFSLKLRLYFDELLKFDILVYDGTPGGSTKGIAAIYIGADGKMMVGAHSVTRLEAQRWYDVEFTIDTDRNTSALKINGEQMGEYGNFQKMGFDVVASDGVGAVRFLIDDLNQAGKYVYMDDVEIKSLSGLPGVCDIKDFSLLSNDAPLDAIDDAEGSITVQLSPQIRSGQQLHIFGGLYENGGILQSAYAKRMRNVNESGKERQISFDVAETAGKALKIYVWQYGTNAPIEKYIIPGRDAHGEDLEILPDTGEDMTEKLQNAIDRLPGGGVLTLKKGKYVISPAFASIYCLSVSGKNNITIDGSGCEFVIDSRFAGFMSVGGSRNVTLKNFTVDYKNAPWELGTVTARSEYSEDGDNGYFDIVTDNTDCMFDTETYKNKLSAGFITLRDSENVKLQKASASEHYWVSSVTPLGGGAYRFGVSGWSAQSLIKGGALSVGDRVVFSGRGMSGSVFYFGGSDNVKVYDVTAYASGECGIKAVNMQGDITLKRSRLMIKDGRPIASNADGAHCQFSRGALKMRDCVFEGLLDDSVNLYQVPMEITGVNGSTVTLTNGSISNLRAGDTVTVFDYRNVKVIGETTVLELHESTGAVQSPSIDAVLDRELELTGGSFRAYINEGMFRGSEIINCRFENSRRYGLYLKCHDIKVEGSTFENLGADAIVCGYLDDEGFNVENAEFTGNTFSNCGYIRYNGKSNSAIWIQGNAPDGRYIHKNIKITGNTVRRTGGTGIRVSAVDGLTLRDNVFLDRIEGSAETVTENCRSAE